MKLNIVAAALSSLAESEVIERGIADTDMDGMTVVMVDAQDIIMRQLVRQGMALQEAEILVEQAAMSNAKPTPESNAFCDEATRNRHLPMPSASTASPPAPAAPQVQSSGTGHEVSSAAEAAAPSAAAPQISATAAPGAPAIVQTPVRVSEPIQRLNYRVHEKSVYDIFPKLDRSNKDFDFALPYLEWERAHPKVPKVDPTYAMIEEDLHTMLYGTVAKKTTNIVGPHGCGKTQLVSQIAARLNFPLHILPMDGQLTRSRLIGQERIRSTSYGPESFFEEGLLAKALHEPGFILFDEVDRAVSDLNYACHSVLTMDGLTLLEDGGRQIPFHIFNRVFGTANTKGRGSFDGMYQAAEEMSEATRDRWSLWIEMDYQDVDSDIAILKANYATMDNRVAGIIANLARLIRDAYLGNTIAQTCSMRGQLEVADMVMFMLKTQQDSSKEKAIIEKCVDRVILGRASAPDKAAIQTMLGTLLP